MGASCVHSMRGEQHPCRACPICTALELRCWECHLCNYWSGFLDACGRYHPWLCWNCSLFCHCSVLLDRCNAYVSMPASTRRCHSPHFCNRPRCSPRHWVFVCSVSGHNFVDASCVHSMRGEQHPCHACPANYARYCREKEGW